MELILLYYQEAGKEINWKVNICILLLLTILIFIPDTNISAMLQQIALYFLFGSSKAQVYSYIEPLRIQHTMA